MPTLRDRIRSLERIPAAQLRANRKNYRTHPEPQRAALRGILSEIGLADALIAYETPEGLTLIDGHLRLEECADETLPVLVLDVTESEADLLLATLDPLAAMAAQDAAKLDALLRDVQTGDQAVADMLTQLAEDAGVLGDEPTEIVEDEIPEPPANPITKPGDLWLLGEHRVLCGDAADPRDIARLLAGETPGLTVVDPPYEMPDSVWSVWIADPSIVFGQMRQMRMIPTKWWRFERVIVKRYRHRSATVQIDHRHAFVAQVGSDRVLPHTSETFPSVLEQGADTEHDHQKPLGLLVEHMTRWTPPWDMVLDPFMGSGTTLIAAEQLGRKCYGMEISPQYCDVIVARWEKMTGKKAVRA
jgi:hypothetical protein